MAKVEMSLVEYDELKETIRLQNEIIAALTTPTYDNWDIDWYNDHVETQMSMSAKNFNNMSMKAKKCLLDIIDTQLSKFIKDNNLEGTLEKIPVDNLSCTLGYLNKYKKVEEGE